MSNYLLAIDGAGNQIYGQQGNRTPVVPVLYNRGYSAQRRRRDRQGGLLGNADATGFPVIPVRLRYQRPANSWRPAPHSANNIRRYYQAFDVSVPFVPPAAPVARYRVAPYVPVPPSIATQIRRYYLPQIMDPAPDAPVDRGRGTPTIIPTSPVPFQVRRYYQPQIIDPTPDQPVDARRSTPTPLPASPVPYRLQRYYQAGPITPVADQPQDRKSQTARASTITSYVPYRIGRYYTTIPGGAVIPPPGDVTVSLDAGGTTTTVSS